MTSVQLVADTNVVSYMFEESPLGFSYEELIDRRRVGLTGHSIAELRAGAVIARWGTRQLDKHLRFLEQFEHVPSSKGMAEVCGALRGLRRQIGEPIDWADAWAAACALWHDVPLVTHDRDHQGIPGLRVVTLHEQWRIGEETFGSFTGCGLWLGEDLSWRRAPGVSRSC